MVTKTTDAKGRLTLGDKFANKTVILQEVDDTEIVVTIARVLPEREAWLYQNPDALSAVRSGLREAREGQLVDGPDLAADEALSDQIKG